MWKSSDELVLPFSCDNPDICDTTHSLNSGSIARYFLEVCLCHRHEEIPMSLPLCSNRLILPAAGSAPVGASMGAGVAARGEEGGISSAVCMVWCKRGCHSGGTEASSEGRRERRVKNCIVVGGVTGGFKSNFILSAAFLQMVTKCSFGGNTVMDAALHGLLSSDGTLLQCPTSRSCTGNSCL